MKVARNSKELAKILDLDPSVTVEWGLRTRLTQEIIKNIKSKKLKIASIAKAAQTSRGRVHKILKNDTVGISLDVMARVLGATGETIKELKFSRIA